MAKCDDYSQDFHQNPRTPWLSHYEFILCTKRAFIRFEKVLSSYPDLLRTTGLLHNLHLNAICNNRYAAIGFRGVAMLDYGAICGGRIELTVKA